MAHGIAGVIAFLSELDARRIERARVRPLLRGAIQWLHAQRLPPSAGAAFPRWVNPGDSTTRAPSRVSWCYGDLGISVALYSAGRNCGVATWERDAVALALAASRRTGTRAGVQDATLCHGAAGNGHLFNRLYQCTGVAEFRGAAVAWFEEALEYWRPGTGIGGFRTWTGSPRLDIAGSRGWLNDPGILTGSAGIALALLAATSRREPRWDRFMLCPPRWPASRR
jgi:hypothetical protein